MNQHIGVGRKYPSIKLNTTYSFGLDDQEFVVSFEGDDPGDFLDLVMELRESETSPIHPTGHAGFYLRCNGIE